MLYLVIWCKYDKTEKARQELLSLHAESSTVESTGQAEAEVMSSPTTPCSNSNCLPGARAQTDITDEGPTVDASA